MLSRAQASDVERAAWFKATPTPMALIDAELRIRGVNSAYERAVDQPRERLLGEQVCDVFPFDPDARTADGPANAIASLEAVLRRPARHCPGVVRYDIPDPRHPGEFKFRAWAPVNTPLTESGRTIAVLHQARNVSVAVPAAGASALVPFEIAAVADRLGREFPLLPSAEIIGALVHSQAVVIGSLGESDLARAAELARLRLEVVAGHAARVYATGATAQRTIE